MLMLSRKNLVPTATRLVEPADSITVVSTDGVTVVSTDGVTGPTATVWSLNCKYSMFLSVSVPSGLPERRSTTFQLPSAFCVT